MTSQQKSGDNKTLEQATFASGCFWCTEAIFQRLKGVSSVVSGYTGGKIANPTYEQVCTGATGHAEAIQITFDPKVIPYSKLLEIFWRTHNPTTLNQQGADIGTQYRSVIFYQSPEQQKQALASKQQIEKEKLYQNPIVTQIVPLSNFYQAEDYHLDYFNKNLSNPYCSVIIDPKVHKLLQEYRQEIKEEYQT